MRSVVAENACSISVAHNYIQYGSSHLDPYTHTVPLLVNQEPRYLCLGSLLKTILTTFPT